MPSNALTVAATAKLISRGGVVAYPTEAVWGLGCDPANEAAVLRLLAIKQRPVDKGLILVASGLQQLQGLVDLGRLPADRRDQVFSTWPGPHTWILPAGRAAPAWVTGVHPGIAIRISAHPVVAALCEACGHALVSTSANLAGESPPVTWAQFDPALLALLDGVVTGSTGGLERPTPIRDGLSGSSLRD